ncbi:MAG: hypothetical protein AB1578_05305 [Thermodesulfobacteriota bacterium]
MRSRLRSGGGRWRALAAGLVFVLLLPTSVLAGTAFLLCTGEDGHAVVEAGGHAAHRHHDREPDQHRPASGSSETPPDEHTCEHEEISVDGLRRSRSALGGPAHGVAQPPMLTLPVSGGAVLFSLRLKHQGLSPSPPPVALRSIRSIILRI